MSHTIAFRLLKAYVLLPGVLMMALVFPMQAYSLPELPVMETDPDTPCTVHAGFSITQCPLCTETFLQFVNGSNNAHYYEWTLNGTLFSTIKNPALFLENAGCHHVMMVASDEFCSDTAEMWLDVYPGYLYSDTASICSGESIWHAGQQFLHPGVHTIIHKTTLGCDSTFRLRLLVDSVAAVFSQSNGRAIAPRGYQSYQWLDCDNHYLPVQGAVSNIFRPVQSGNYTVVVGTASCSDTADCQYITVTGILEPFLSAGVTVYPNPVREILYISGLPQRIPFRANIISTDGRILGEHTISANYPMIIHGLPPGIYQLSVPLPDHPPFVVKFMVE